MLLRAVDRWLVAAIQAAAERWDSLVTARQDSSVHRMKAYLLRQPVINTKTVAAELQISEVAAQNAIDKLVEAQVITKISTGNEEPHRKGTRRTRRAR